MLGLQKADITNWFAVGRLDKLQETYVNNPVQILSKKNFTMPSYESL